MSPVRTPPRTGPHGHLDEPARQEDEDEVLAHGGGRRRPGHQVTEPPHPPGAVVVGPSPPGGHEAGRGPDGYGGHRRAGAGRRSPDPQRRMGGEEDGGQGQDDEESRSDETDSPDEGAEAAAEAPGAEDGELRRRRSRQHVGRRHAVLELAGREPPVLVDAEPTEQRHMGGRSAEADDPDPGPLPGDGGKADHRLHSTEAVTGDRRWRRPRVTFRRHSVDPMAVVGRFSRARRHHEEAPLPLPAGPVSNGEFVPAASHAGHRATDALIRSTVESSATRTGMDRRLFLQSAGAVAASLAAFELAGCAGPPAGRSSKTHGVRTGRYLPQRPPRRRRRLSRDAGHQGRVHLRRPHPSCDPGRPLGAQRPRHRRPHPRHASRRLYRQPSARLCGPGHLSPRHVPGQRHHGGRPHRRPQLGTRPTPPSPFPMPWTPRRSPPGSPMAGPPGYWWRTSWPRMSVPWGRPSTR